MLYPRIKQSKRYSTSMFCRPKFKISPKMQSKYFITRNSFFPHFTRNFLIPTSLIILNKSGLHMHAFTSVPHVTHKLNSHVAETRRLVCSIHISGAPYTPLTRAVVRDTGSCFHTFLLSTPGFKFKTIAIRLCVLLHTLQLCQ